MKFAKRIIALSLALAVSAGILAGCGGANSNAKVLRLNNSEEPGSLHPAIVQGSHESWILENIMEGLYKKDPGAKIVPGIAKEEATVSEDGLVYTFKLRDDAVWTNGDPVTAQDFEFSWKYTLNPNTPSNYSYQLYYIKGAEAFNTSKETDAAKLKELENAVGIKSLDDKTLEVTLERPTPYFLELTSFFTYLPVNKKVQEANANWDKEAETYVSNGPFTMTEWNHKQNIKLTKNETYYDKDKIKLEGVDFAMISDENTAWQMYQSGELHLTMPVPQEITAKLRAEGNDELNIAPDFTTYFYRFNTTRKPFNNVKVRKALAMAMDRTALVEKVVKGGQTPAYGFVTMGIPDENGNEFQTNNYFKEDFVEAKRLLEEGLKEEGMSLNTFSFTILYNTMESHKKIAEAIQDMWKKNLGVNVKLENVEFQVKLDREDKLDYDVSRSGWTGDYVDPMTFLDMFLSTSTQNDSGFANAEYDKLIHQAQSSNDQKVRMEAMRKAEKILMDEMPIIPIYFYTRPYVLKSNVEGVFDIVNRYPQFKYAEIK